MSMLISQGLARMSSGARRAMGVMGVVLLAVVVRHAKIGLVVSGYSIGILSKILACAHIRYPNHKAGFDSREG